MNSTEKRDLKAVIYLENCYQGNLSQNDLESWESLPWNNWLSVWLQSLEDEFVLSDPCELTLRCVGDRQMQEFNQQYRGFDRPTDVLAFAATEVDIPQPLDLNEPLYLGDIIISLDTAKKQARKQQHSLTVELAWLASHGLLHLLGWDHPDERSLANMLKLQANMLKSAEITDKIA